MIVIGVDLSGPRNAADTYVVVFKPEGGQLQFSGGVEAADDQRIVEVVAANGRMDRVIVGLDAPLSYNAGGGDRASDAELRRRVRAVGGGAGVMPPTMIRMVYLTLRGVALTRWLELLRAEIDLQIVEVHPEACMLLGGAPADQVATFKHEPAARGKLLDWLAARGLNGIPAMDGGADHFVAACAAALGAWQWSLGRSVWRFPAQPPAHPYDFAC
jgi:predicted nuclease with RNAse H fold